MDNKRLVSIIVPVYNVGEYLSRCLDSLLAQDYPALEIILVDDASTDNSSAIAQEYANQHASVCFVPRTVNGGLSAARNTGIEHATGEWLCFVDSDDWVEADYVSALLKEALKVQADITVCNYDHVWEGGRVQAVDSIGNLQTESDHRLKVALLRNHVVTRIYKRSLFTDTGLRFPEDIRRSEDMAISPALLSYANHIAILPRTLYHYYQRAGSLSNQNVRRQDYGFIDASLKRMTHNMKPGFEKEAQARVIMETLYSKVMLQLTNGYARSQVRREVQAFMQAHPDWRSNPYLQHFPGMKRRFILLTGHGWLLPAWALTKAWAIFKRLKGV